MNYHNKIIKFFKSHKIKGEYIFYGSSAKEYKENSDIDVCILIKSPLNIEAKKKIIEEYIKFQEINNFMIDEEVKYIDKLFLTKEEVKKNIDSFFKSLKEEIKPLDLSLNYKDAIKRLVINILTTKVNIYEKDNSYLQLSKYCWEKLFQSFQSLNPDHEFQDFINFFKITKNYKLYLGYNIKDIEHYRYHYNNYFNKNNIIFDLKENVKNTPNKIAVYDSNSSITYKELDELSDSVAWELSKNIEKNIVVIMPKLIKSLIVIYGIIKSGKTYVPLNIEDSPQNIELILKTIDDKIIIKDDNNLDKILEKKYPSFKLKWGDIAYIIHTSGTTGTPKGVKVTYGNLNYILEGIQNKFPVNSDSCYLFSTDLTFDVSITEIFGFLKNGASVFICSLGNIEFYKKFTYYIEKYKLTHIALSPSVFYLILKKLEKSDIKIINKYVKFFLIAGEAFKTEILPYLKKIKTPKIYNVYGPTEATVYATYYQINPEKNYKESIPIGKGFKGTELIIQEGELLIGGDGVADGYYNNRAKTKESFIKLNDKVFYKTGDFVEKNSDDLLIYKGRRDGQVQVSGIRVELGEIEHIVKKIICSQEEREIVILYHEKKIILFYTGEKIENIFEILKKEMALYKIPKLFKNIKEIPLNKNGKTDKKELIKNLNYNEKFNKIDRKDEMKIKIAKIIHNITNINLSDQSNIFEYGIDSLGTVEIFLELENEFNISFKEHSLYSLPTIDIISSYILKEKSNKKKINLEKIKIKIINNKIPNLKEPNYKYPLYFYGRIYNTLNFKSIIYDKINFSFSKIKYEEIVKRLSTIEVFKTLISLDDGAFNYYDNLDINITKVYQKNLNLDIKDNLINLVFSNRKNHGYQYKMIYAYNDNEAILYYAIDHSIFDASCKDLLEKVLTSVKLENSLKYSEYINETLLRNTFKSIDSSLIHQEVKLCSQTNLKEVLGRLEDKIIYETIPSNDYSTEEVYIQIIYWLKENLLEKNNIDKCNINIIYNLRNYRDKKIENTIGDVHLGITYPYQNNIDIREKFNKLLDFYRETMYNPKSFAYKDFPEISKEQQQIINLYDDQVFLNINYLGIINETEFNELRKESENFKKEINKLNKNKLNLTIFTYNKKLIVRLTKVIKK